MKNGGKPNSVIPVNIDADGLLKEDFLRDIEKQHERYGFCRFVTACFYIPYGNSTILMGKGT